MKILHISPWYAPAWAAAGTAVSVTNFCEGLANINYNVTVFTTLDSGEKIPLCKNSYFKKRNHVKVYYFKCGILGSSFRGAALSIEMAFAIFRNIRKFDLIHLHSTRNLYGIITFIACKLYKKSYVLTPHASIMKDWIEKMGHYNLKKFYIFLLDKFVLSNASKIHFLSEYEAFESKKYVFNKNYFVVNNGIQISKQNDYPKKELSPCLKIIVVGRVTPQKNIHLIIEALSLIKEKKISLDIIGPFKDYKYYEFCKEIIHQNNLTNIKFLGSLNNNQVLNLYQKYDLLCMPSIVEGYSVVILEAASKGVPSIITKGHSNFEEIISSNSGILVETNKYDISEKIIKFYSDKKLQKKMSENAYQYALNNYSIVLKAHQLSNEYKAILNKKMIGNY